MTNITAQLVKTLRERTGAGMMECKRALVETQGDLEQAVDHMRKAGLAKADKKADRTAAEGAVCMAEDPAQRHIALLEINCETDFVGRGDAFLAFAQTLSKLALAAQTDALDTLMSTRLPNGKTAEEVRRELVANVGENIAPRRAVVLQAAASQIVGHYLHGQRIGVAVLLEGGDDALARDIAMHIAASKPLCIEPGQLNPEVVNKERDIYRAQAQQSGKPADIVEKMVEGRMRKFTTEVTLLGQPFVKDPEQTIGNLLKTHQARVLRFERFELGEGIEKKQDDFVGEVMAQARGA